MWKWLQKCGIGRGLKNFEMLDAGKNFHCCEGTVKGDSDESPERK